MSVAKGTVSAFGPGVVLNTHSSTCPNTTRMAATSRSRVSQFASRVTPTRVERSRPFFICRAADMQVQRSPERQRPKSAALPTKWRLRGRTVLDVDHHNKEARMSEDRLSRIGPLSGALFVVL